MAQKRRTNNRRSPRRDGKPHGTATGQKGITEAQIIRALMMHGGVLAHAADALDVTRSNLSHRIGNSETLLQARVEARERTVDLAEGVVLYHLKKKNLPAATFVLDRMGKDRGFTKQVQHVGKEGGAIEHVTTSAEVGHHLTKEEIELARGRYINDGDDD